MAIASTGGAQPRPPSVFLSLLPPATDDRRLALSLCEEFQTGRERVKAWTAKTGKGKSAFYRRYEELKAQGLIGGHEDILADNAEVSPPSRSPEPNGGTTMRLVLG